MVEGKKKKNEGKEGEKREGEKQAQHSGVGKFLMAVAERVSWMYGFDELAVISGVGVRGYYEKVCVFFFFFFFFFLFVCLFVCFIVLFCFVLFC